MVHDPFGSREHDNDESLAKRARRQSRKQGKREFKGLCVNCANRYTCLLPRSEGGVWHCEEYLEER
jgi:hypothetical protein